MRVLFFTAYPVSVHLYTYLELMANHMEAGDEVHLISCDRELETCFANRDMVKGLCEFCVAGVESGLEEIGFTGERYHLRDFVSEQEKSLIDSESVSTVSSLDELQSLKINNFDIGYGVASSLISYTRNADLCFGDPQILRYIESLYRVGQFVYTAMYNAIDAIEPERIYVFNGRFVESRACMRAAELQNVDFMITEIVAQGRRYRLFENSLPHDIAYRTREIQTGWDSAEPNAREKAIIAAGFFEKKRSGEPVNDSRSYVSGQKLGQLPAGWDESCRNIVIFNSSEDEFASIGPEWKNPVYVDQVQAVEELCRDLQGEGCRVYLRIHPNLAGLDNDFTTRLFSLQNVCEGLYLIRPESTISSYSLMEAADVVVTFGSTVGVEATYWGKPVILLGKALYYHLDVAYVPTTHEEAVALLKQHDLQPKPKSGALMLAYHWMTEGIEPIHFTGIHGKARFHGRIINGLGVKSIARAVSKSGVGDLAYFGRRMITFFKLRFGR